MAEITATDVAKLREMTGVGMMKCKKALVEANGDINVAVDLLRKSGAVNAETKSPMRHAKASSPSTSPRVENPVLVEVNCRADFVAHRRGVPRIRG